jgi:hypothetical protein
MGTPAARMPENSGRVQNRVPSHRFMMRRFVNRARKFASPMGLISIQVDGPWPLVGRGILCQIPSNAHMPPFQLS